MDLICYAGLALAGVWVGCATAVVVKTTYHILTDTL